MARAADKTATLLLAGVIALTGPSPVNASQKVALPNGEVLKFYVKKRKPTDVKRAHSTDIMQRERGPNSVVWRILMRRLFIWDPGDKEIVESWIGSRAGQAQIKSWMTKGDTHGTVFHNADVVLKDYFGVSSR